MQNDNFKYEELPVCNQILCLYRDNVYCTKDYNYITPNTNSCKYFTLHTSITNKNN